MSCWSRGLAELGAIHGDSRVVVDGRYVTAAGVSAGIDMALALAAQLARAKIAKAFQLSVSTTLSRRSKPGAHATPCPVTGGVDSAEYWAGLSPLCLCSPVLERFPAPARLSLSLTTFMLSTPQVLPYRSFWLSLEHTFEEGDGLRDHDIGLGDG